jgi:hypothetical protein
MEICIGSKNGEHVIIRILGNTDSEGWVIAEIDVHAGAWKGFYQASLRPTEDFPSFRQQLQDLYDWKNNEAIFSTMEEWLTLNLTLDHLGHVHIKGTAIDQPGTGNMLSFYLELDQSYLPRIITELSQSNVNQQWHNK